MLDVLIAGGGTAGLAAAIWARLQGLSALVCEPRHADSEKACGEGLMPGALRALAAMGVRPEGGYPLHGIHYEAGPRRADGRFRGGEGLGLRRLALSAALRQRALELGAGIDCRRLSGIVQHADRIVVAGIEARWLIIADGLRSSLRHELGLDLPPRLAPRYGVRCHYRVKPWSHAVEVHWGKRAEVYLTPVGDSEMNVAILSYAEQDHQACRGEFPDLFARLGEPLDKPLGAGPFEHRVRRRVAGRALLVGDAAGYLDAITGEGNHLALRSAQAAIAAIKADKPQSYERAWRRLARRYWFVTALLLAVSKYPRLRPLIVRLLGTSRTLFSWVLSLLDG